MPKENICPTCQQVVQQAHKETLSKIKAEMLRAAAQHVISTGVNDFKKSDIQKIGETHSAYANFQKLRYHGLLAQVRRDGIKHRDRWLVTRNGWAWLRGDIQLPKYVVVQNNHIKTKADALVGWRDVMVGAEYLETQFEYFDDDGHMVGFRPSTPQPAYRQGALL